MKIPVSPKPFSYDDIDFAEILSSPFSFPPTDERGRYLHWDKVRHLDIDDPWLHWRTMRTARKIKSRLLPLKMLKEAFLVFLQLRNWINSSIGLIKMPPAALARPMRIFFPAGKLFIQLIDRRGDTFKPIGRRGDNFVASKKKCCVKNGVPQS